LDLRGEEWRETGEDYIMRSFIIFYSLPYNITVTKPRRMRYDGHVARVEIMINCFKILVGIPKGKESLGRNSVGGGGNNVQVDIREIFCFNSPGPGLGPVTGSCGRCNEFSGSIRGGEILE